MKLSSIIVDDENFNIDLLSDVIQKNFSEHLSVDATSNNYFDAIEKINSIKPQVLFLDIKLDRGTAFDLLSKIDEYNYIVVFVTAYSEYVLEALKYNTAYYILKPTTIKQVEESILSVKNTFSSQNYTSKTQINNLIRQIGFSRNNKFIDIHPSSNADNRISHIRCDSVQFIKADGRHSDIHLMNGAILKSNRSIKHFEEVLRNDSFIRSHKSYIVNLKKVKCITKSGGYYCELINGKYIPISKNNIPLLYYKLNLSA